MLPFAQRLLELAGGGQGKEPLGNGPRGPIGTSSPTFPQHLPCSSFLPLLRGPCSSTAALLSPFHPVLPPTSGTLIQQVFAWCFAPSAAQIPNMKNRKSFWAKAKMLFRVCCCCGVHLHYQSEIKARCFTEDFSYLRFSFVLI